MHIQNVDFQIGSKAVLQLHTRLRVRDDWSDFYQARFGPILTYNLRPRLQAIAGFYYIDQRSRGTRRWGDYNRFFGGFSTRLVTKPKWTLDSRTLVERFTQTGGIDYTRGRTRGTLQLPRGNWMPWFTAEALYAQDRATFRLGGHLSRRMAHGVTTTFGYELRQYTDRSYGHILVTQFLFRPPRSN